MKLDKNKILFDITEIRNHVDTIKNNKEKCEYLKYLNDELSHFYYNFKDSDRESLLKKRGLNETYPKVIPYERSKWFPESSEQMHSAYRVLLNDINKNVLPYVRTEWHKLEKLLPKKETEIIQKELPIEKIIWKDNHTDLVYLFDELIRLKLIVNPKHINKFIATHFTWEDSEINPDELGDLRSKLKKGTYPLDASLKITKK